MLLTTLIQLLKEVDLEIPEKAALVTNCKEAGEEIVERAAKMGVQLKL